MSKILVYIYDLCLPNGWGLETYGLFGYPVQLLTFVNATYVPKNAGLNNVNKLMSGEDTGLSCVLTTFHQYD